MEKGETSRQMGDEWDGDGGTPAATPGGGGPAGGLLWELTAHTPGGAMVSRCGVCWCRRAYLFLRAPSQTRKLRRGLAAPSLRTSDSFLLLH